MEKDKIIEEIAKVIDDRLIEANNYFGSMNKGTGYWLAQKLVEYYQPKLPEGAVAVPKDLWEEHIVHYDKMFENIKQQARKETAKEILRDIKYEIEDRNGAMLEEDFPVDATILQEVLNEIAKQYGVEVEE